jgi:uncharacterized glyoxalase superfamily protein PhnB
VSDTTPPTGSGDPPTLTQFNGFEIYPMPAFATLEVDDVRGVAAWYERTLGFRTVFAAPDVGGQPGLVHLRRRKYQDLLLTRAIRPAELTAPTSLTLSFNADGDVDAIAALAGRAETLGRSSVAGPVNTPWHTRDLRVTDPAGHRLVFTERRTDVDPESRARMQKMFERARKQRA